jgi:V-type H+-transporting ATPase subunit a
MIVHEHGHTFGEMFIHQMIETIEYALGTVSNTASYLRLWALSLAHGQLAKVFFNYTVGISLGGGQLALWMMFYVFFAITFAVLMVMDLLEAMLHTLRLHWVEFQNKFFKGEGFSFAPMDFQKVFDEAD